MKSNQQSSSEMKLRESNVYYDIHPDTLCLGMTPLLYHLLLEDDPWLGLFGQ